MCLKYSSLFNGITYLTFFAFTFCLLIGCQTEQSASPDVEVTELSDYNTIVSYEDGTLATPVILRFGNNSHLFVYDAGKHEVLELDGNGEVVNTYGGSGRGPGEFLMAVNMFLSDNHLYVVDRIQYRISRFTLGGGPDGALNYGQEGSMAMPPPAPRGATPRALDINNQPVVTLNGDLLLSAVSHEDTVTSLYKLMDWEGNHLSDIGKVPEGSAFTLDYDRYQRTVGNGEIPAYYKPNAFPVNDRANADEFYLVYTSFPKIAKYNASGEELWETDVPKTAELDTITTNFYDISEEMRGKSRIDLDKYMSGVSSPDGHLYLVLGKNGFADFFNGLWIHKFNPKGKLVDRFKLISNDVDLASIFEIDFSRDIIFVVTEEAEIRAYPF